MEKAKQEKELKKFKEKYDLLRRKYTLPSFQYLNENFEIENLAAYDTELVLKKIRKQILEKIYYTLRVLETFLNPSNAPLFVFNLIKSFDQYEKDLINELYKKLSEYEIILFGLEATYDEKKEADFIKDFCNFWKENSGKFNELYLILKKNFKQDNKKQDKSYFG